MAISKVTPGRTRRRAMRSPQFDISGSLFPHGLGVLAAFPVLPGETITRMRMKSRVMSHPIASPLGGAHYEVAAFYVKLSDIDKTYRDFFTVEGHADVSALGADRYYTGQISGDSALLDAAFFQILEDYFRDAGEAQTPRFGSASTPYVVKRDNRSWFNNLGLQFTEAALTGTSASDDARELSAGDIYRLKMMEETSFDDYVEQFGVTVPPQDIDRPEMFYYSRAWSMPRNSVEPSTGVPASMWAWSPALDMQKRIRFREPGMVVLMHWVRPKTYLDGVRSMLSTAFDLADFYVDPYTLEDPLAGAKKINFTDLPVPSGKRTDVGDSGLIYDANDLWVHGEQWVVNAMGTASDYAVPTVSQSFNDADDDYDRRGAYPTQAEMEALFTGATTGTRLIAYDGLLVADISGHVQDHIG